VLDCEIVISAEIFLFDDLLQRFTGCIGDDFCLTAEDRKNAALCLDERASATQYEFRRLKA
jgi:hypothetical protein